MCGGRQKGVEGGGVNGFSKHFRNVMALKTVGTAAKVSWSTESGLYHFFRQNGMSSRGEAFSWHCRIHKRQDAFEKGVLAESIRRCGNWTNLQSWGLAWHDSDLLHILVQHDSNCYTDTGFGMTVTTTYIHLTWWQRLHILVWHDGNWYTCVTWQ